METLTTEDKILYKKLVRNKKAREAYYKATIEGRNKKLVNITGPSKRGRKKINNEIIDNNNINKELTEKEKLFESIRQENRKQEYKRIINLNSNSI